MGSCLTLQVCLFLALLLSHVSGKVELSSRMSSFTLLHTVPSELWASWGNRDDGWELPLRASPTHTTAVPDQDSSQLSFGVNYHWSEETQTGQWGHVVAVWSQKWEFSQWVKSYQSWGHLESKLSLESRNQSRQLESTRQEANPESRVILGVWPHCKYLRLKFLTDSQAIDFKYLEGGKVEITST